MPSISIFTAPTVYSRLERTKNAMNIKDMTEERFQSLKAGLKSKNFNRKVHGKLTYQLLKNMGYKPPYQFTYLPKFPRFKVSMKKIITIHTVCRKLPFEIIHNIKEYLFDRLDEVCYSLFYLADDIYYLNNKNTVIRESFSRRSIATNNPNIDDNQTEYWTWEYIQLYFNASNCVKCGGYKTTNTEYISSVVLCNCGGGLH